MQATAASYGSVGFLGVPLVHTLWGTEAALAALVVLVSVRVMHALVLPVLVFLARPRSPAKVLAQLIRSTLADPLLLAIAAALGVEMAGISLPETLAIVVDLLASAAVATALFAVTIALARQRIGRFGWEVPVVATVKLVVAPFITYGVVLAIGGFEPVWIIAAVFASAMPTAARAEGIAGGGGVYGQGMADCVLLSGMVGVVTVTVLVWLIDAGALPMTAAELLAG
jgi:predicted permease